MRLSLRHILFIAGIISVFTSFLFIGRKHNTYTALLFGGLAVTGITYLTMLYGKETNKSMVIWTLVLLISIFIEQLAEPKLIKSSFLMYVKNNRDDLGEINEMLMRHKGALQVFADTIITKDMELEIAEASRLIELRNRVDAYMISKSRNNIYYGLWGFLDVRHGVWYSINGDKPQTTLNCRSLKGDWYY